MNIFGDDASGLALVVSRGVIPEDSDAEKEFQRQWDTLRSQMGHIQRRRSLFRLRLARITLCVR